MQTGNRKIGPEELTAGKIIMVEGNVEFARLTRLIEGADLEEHNRRRRERAKPGDFVVTATKPFTTITISNPRVIPTSEDGQLTIEDKYIAQRFYTSHPGNDMNVSRQCFTMESKSSILPRYYQVAIDENGVANYNDIREKPRLGELANGLKVRLLIRVFQAGTFRNKGISLDSVIVLEPIRYFNSSGSRAVQFLRQTGVTVHEMSEEDRAKEAGALATAQTAPAPQPPITPPPIPAQGEAYVNQAPMAPPTPPATPSVNAGEWMCEVCGTVNQGGNYCNGCGNPKPISEPQGFQPTPGMPMFNPNDNKY
jgi:hypothetical protein